MLAKRKSTQQVVPCLLIGDRVVLLGSSLADGEVIYLPGGRRYGYDPETGIVDDVGPEPAEYGWHAPSGEEL